MGTKTQSKPTIPPKRPAKKTAVSEEGAREYVFRMNDPRLLAAACVVVYARSPEEAIAQGYLMADALTEAINGLRV